MHNFHVMQKEEKINDTISRQQVIDYCEALMNAERLQQTDDWGYGRERYNQTECIMHHIENMPSVQSERSKGKWIIQDNPGTGWYRITCSECGEDVTSEAPTIGFMPECKVLWDYCPYCGSYNGEEENDYHKRDI